MSSHKIHPTALFRLTVLGPLLSRERLERGDVQQMVRELAQRSYDIPGTQRCHLSEKTIQAWYHAYRRAGIDALVPKVRADRGRSKLAAPIQEAIVAAKQDKARRSIRQILRTLEASGAVAAGSVSRSAVHRLLQQHGLSRTSGSASEPEERRSFTASTAGSLWYGDVMHGPQVPVKGRMRKTYLVSLMDDASRLIAHSAFCLGESALDIEGVLKQALLRRGVPHRLIVDNGAAYRSQSLQGICARLGIQIIYCRPYRPEGKGKLERWHRRCRDQFLAELDATRIGSLQDLNARLWAWLEQVYHRTAHGGLAGLTPLARYQQDLPKIRTLGALAAGLDALFHHRVSRHVRRDGTVSYQGARFEVPFELSGRHILLVVDAHTGRVLGAEDEHGKPLGEATPLDAAANLHRVRHKPAPASATDASGAGRTPNLVEIAHAKHYDTSEN
jgi:transposase InsO family protein